MTKHFTYIIFTIALIACGLTLDKNEKVKPGEIQITWGDNLAGDFSFTENWDYPEGIYKNDFGQLSCDGICPPEVDRMKDENGKIHQDSLKAFYQLVDTTHQFHSIQSDAWTYEWAGTNFVTTKRINADTTVCFTHKNAATHSSLILTITKDKCIPIIELNSIVRSTGTKIYPCKSGQIEIDKNLWKRGILKANLDLTFDHKENPGMPMFWKGKIYTTIDDK
jgi:hypothetical protein